MKVYVVATIKHIRTNQELAFKTTLKQDKEANIAWLNNILDKYFEYDLKSISLSLY